jgi:putative DNA primase/helicase
MSELFTKYLDAGFSVIPIRCDGSKGPAVASWKTYQTARPTIEEARDWDLHHRGVAVICGAVSGGGVSGGLEVLDVDEPTLARPFLDAVKEQDPNLVAKLTMIRTPRRNASGKGGMHLWYRCESPVPGNLKLAMSEPEPEVDDQGQPVINPTTGKQNAKPRTLVETRGEGGYVLAPGCAPECHPTGNLYEHVYGPPVESLSVLTAAERETLIRTAKTFDRSVAETHAEPTITGYRPDDQTPGQAYADRVSWADILEPAGWRCVGESGGIKRWRRPGKSQGLSATTGLMSKQGNELLCVFSSNAFPFEGPSAGRTCTTYSKFAAFTHLNHGGDFQAAARTLAGLGYGDPPRKEKREQRVMLKTMESAERRFLEGLRRGESMTVSLGIPAIDEAIGGGVEKAEVVILAARTSHGKTLVALQVARSFVGRGENVLVVSEEMSERALSKRSISARTRLPEQQWPDHVEDLERQSRDYWSNAGRMFIVESCQTITRVEQAAADACAEFPIALIVVDYAQMLTDAGNSRHERIASVSTRLSALSKKHDCIMLILGQLNREAEKAGGDYGLHHIADSDQLGRDADVAVIFEWPWKADADYPDPREYRVTVAKTRNRPTVKRKFSMEFCPEYQCIKTRDYPVKRNQVFDEWNDGKAAAGGEFCPTT